jgi:hypothetical protein
LQDNLKLYGNLTISVLRTEQNTISHLSAPEIILKDSSETIKKQ